MTQRTGKPVGRPKGSKSAVKGFRNHNLAKREKRAEFISQQALNTFNDPASTPEQKAEAWKTHLEMEERLTTIGLARQKLKEKETIHRRPIPAAAPVLENDPKPIWYPRDGGKYSDYLAELSAWESRHPEGEPEPAPTPAPAVKIIETPKPVPVVIEQPIAPVRVAPKPAPVKPRPVAPVRVREPREGYSGVFFREVFWDLPSYERNALLQILRRDHSGEWNNIMMAMRAPREVLPPASEAQKAAAFSSPSVRPRDQAFATGQPQTVEEFQKTYSTTIGDSTASGVTPELDRRS